MNFEEDGEILLIDGNLIGPGRGRYLVGPIQFGLCYATVIPCILVLRSGMFFH